MGEFIDRVYKPIRFLDGGVMRHGLGAVVEMMSADLLNLAPVYQRPQVWRVDQQAAFMGHLLSGGFVPPVVFNRLPITGADDGFEMEVLDGQQRLRAIKAFMEGSLGASLMDDTRVHIGNFDDVDVSYLLGPTGPGIQVGYVELPQVEAMRLYLRLNSGGTPHTRRDLDRVRRLIAREGNPLFEGPARSLKVGEVYYPVSERSVYRDGRRITDYDPDTDMISWAAVNLGSEGSCRVDNFLAWARDVKRH